MTAISARTLLTDFSLANPLYANATVQVLEANETTWLPTQTLAPLYAGPTGTQKLANPQRLDGDGRWVHPVYVDRPVVIRVGQGQVPTHDTGVAGLVPTFRGQWATGENYGVADIARYAPTGKLYIAAIQHVAGAVFTDDLAAGKWELYVDASQPVSYHDIITQSETGYFFQADGARINRMADRLFLGSAVHNDGSSLGGGANADWFSRGAPNDSAAGLAWVHYAASVALTVPSGKVGFAAASRASDVPDGYGSSQTTIPFVGVAIMDRVGSAPPYWTSYAAYLEARVEPATIGTVIGLEIEAVNFGPAAGQSTPWRLQTLAGATALWIGSGGDPANHGRSVGPAQLAIGIINNGQKFESGLVFAKDAIHGTDGVSGFGDAILLASRHIVGWWRNDGGIGERTNYITSTATQRGHSLQFHNGATLLINANDQIDFAVSNVSSAVNGIGIKPAVTGGQPAIETFGDTNVDLRIQPAGTGNVALYCEQILFYDDVGHQLAGLINSVNNDNFMNTLQFANGGPFFYGRGGVIASFSQVANPVSYISISNAASGDAPGFTAQGTGDVDILLSPAGSNGTLRLVLPSVTSAQVGGASALPGPPAGYFKVRDAGGTMRTVPYWNP
jgi:hypothetical protein